MLRFLLAPRQLVVHLVALLLMAGMAWLSLWQLGKAHGEAAGPTAQVAISAVSTPGAAVAPGGYERTVSATGQYVAGRQVRVPGRQLDGQVGDWVLLPLQLPDGSAVAVVRGWIPADAALPAAPAGSTTVVGTFLPPEEGPARAASTPDTVAAVDLSQLGWPYRVHEGYVLAAEETPAPPTTPTRIPAANAVPSDTGAPFSNLGYALQWWAFAGFVAFLWWRILRDRRREQATPPATPSRPAVPTSRS